MKNRVACIRVIRILILTVGHAKGSFPNIPKGFKVYPPALMGAASFCVA